MKTPSFPTHLLPPKSNPRIEGVPAAVEAEFQSYLDRARVGGMEQIHDIVYYDSNSDVDDDNDDDDDDDNDTFHDTSQIEDVIEDSNDGDATIHGESINHEFLSLIGQEIRATGVTIKHEGVLYVQYSNYHRELYYKS